MRIVLDLQGAQTASRLRGIGRYSLSLAKAIVLNRGEHEVIIALSGLIPETIEPIRNAFAEILPQENIVVWNTPGPVREYELENSWRRISAEYVRESFIASLEPDILHVSSLFEGFIDDAVISLGEFTAHIPTVITLYDLIPLANPKDYLDPNPIYKNYYLKKIEHLKKATKCLAISNFTANEAIQMLNLTSENVVNISSGASFEFRPNNLTIAEQTIIKNRFNLSKPFLLYSGGYECRKNLKRLLKAFSILPSSIRKNYQLLILGCSSPADTSDLKEVYDTCGFSPNEILFAGHVSDNELVDLYSLCELFVFPSWHEGFGLPVLEAMSCGAAVVCANTSSLPEVIGRSDVLFDPFSEISISEKIIEVLLNKELLSELKTYGRERAKLFSWDKCALKCIATFEDIYKTQKFASTKTLFANTDKPKLAFVSPLPPERTGIADYSVELLVALVKFYEITVIIDQETISTSWIKSNCNAQKFDWFLENSENFDRVLYHFGNSPFHLYMIPLLERIPGTIVLHDFYLSNLPRCLELFNIQPGALAETLYYSHGYTAVKDLYKIKDHEAVAQKYPANLKILHQAQGVIVHSEYSRQLAKQWYGEQFSNQWKTIPLLRTPPSYQNTSDIRKLLNLNQSDFVVCSFGLLDPSKLNHRLLKAWLNSKLAKNKNCVLVFVGENHGGAYGAKLLEEIEVSGLKNQIRITGWASVEVFQNYLKAANIAVQLRTSSRGETSAAVLDCLCHGIPTIVNANGSMQELASDSVWMLNDEFSDSELVDALEVLWQEKNRRLDLGQRAIELTQKNHSPTFCANLYHQAIEQFSQQAQSGVKNLVAQMAKQIPDNLSNLDTIMLAEAIAQNTPRQRASKQFLLDITATHQHDLKTGIERVVRALVIALINSAPAGYRVEPVYLCNEGGKWHYRYAKKYTLRLMSSPDHELNDEPVIAYGGDILIGLDNSGHKLIEAEKSGLHRDWMNLGIKIYSMVYDLLPVEMPIVFPQGADQWHSEWLNVIYKFTGAICISNAVADSLTKWTGSRRDNLNNQYKISWLHLGADVDETAPSKGLPTDALIILQNLQANPIFLMVGTIEPRKGHLQVIKAFTHLWSSGIKANLIIVGQEGWKGLPDDMRREIPEIKTLLNTHAELGKQLFWHESVSDEYLATLYSAATCLVAASYGEGFGLPLIEAAKYKLPIIARDIPVFREVAGDNAYYFSGLEAEDLSGAINDWIGLYKSRRYPKSDAIPWLTWKETSQQLLRNIGVTAQKITTQNRESKNCLPCDYNFIN